MPPQTLTITLEFKEEHKPGSPEHLEQVAKNYFEGKGVYLEGKVIRI